MIPHVTGEVKDRLRELAIASRADVVFVEIGGTVGDVENAYYIEAMRQLAFEEGPRSVCFVALTYVMEPSILGEQKSKAAQLGIRRLLECGIQPQHRSPAAAQNPVTHKVREKIAMFSNVPARTGVPSACTTARASNQIPEMFARRRLRPGGNRNWLRLENKVDEQAERASREVWGRYLARLRSAEHQVTIGITGKYTAVRDAYASILKALEHAGVHWGCKVHVRWIDTSHLNDQTVSEAVKGLDGIIVPGAFATRGADGPRSPCLRRRMSKLPCLGICYASKWP